MALPSLKHPHTVILPSETQSREFDAKLLLACALAERGLPTIVGSRVSIHNHLHHLAQSVYVAKDFRKPSSRIFGILKGLGTSIVAWDEEGLLFFDAKTYYQRRVHAPNLAQVKEFFAWGPLNAKITAAAPGYHDQPIHLTGNPRIDLLRPELRGIYQAEIAKLKSRFGKFILINTNFGILNHHLPAHIAKTGGKDRVTGKQATPATNAKLLHLGEVFENFKTMLVPLAQRFPEHTVVVRPHPSENLDAWRAVAGDQPNIIVVHEGPVQPWLLACDVMVHNSCTTGIEGYQLGAPVISYRPIRSDIFDHKISNDLSHQVFTRDEMMLAVEKALQGKLNHGKTAERDEILTSLFFSLSGELASDQIAKRISELVATPGFIEEAPWTSKWRAKLHSKARSSLRLITAHIPEHKNSKAYTLNRFPGLEITQVQKRIGDYQEALHRFDNVTAVQVAQDIFMVEAKPVSVT